MKPLLNLKYSLTATAAGFVLAIDQATKILVHTRMELGETIPVVSSFFNFHYVRNSGGAFGLFGSSSELVKFILFLFFPIICVFIIFLVLRTTESKTEITALGFILGGAFGNYIDRLKLGSVVDFIDWYVTVGENSWHWPTFNMADSFIVIGGGMLIAYHVFFQIQENKKNQTKKGTVLKTQ